MCVCVWGGGGGGGAKEWLYFNFGVLRLPQHYLSRIETMKGSIAQTVAQQTGVAG